LTLTSSNSISKRSHIYANIHLNLIMFNPTSANKEKNGQEVVIYNHRDSDIEIEASVNPTFANTNTDEAADDERISKRCFSKKIRVVCGVACAVVVVGVAGIVGAASASVRSTQQVQKSYAEAIIGKGRGGERKPNTKAKAPKLPKSAQSSNAPSSTSAQPSSSPSSSAQPSSSPSSSAQPSTSNAPSSISSESPSQSQTPTP
jgi:hypothetical protein